MKGWILALLLLLTLGGCSADDTAVTTTVPDALPVEQEAVEQTKPAGTTDHRQQHRLPSKRGRSGQRSGWLSAYQKPQLSGRIGWTTQESYSSIICNKKESSASAEEDKGGTTCKKINPVKGTADYLPSQARVRDYLQKVILDTYRAAGFERIMTPAIEDMENLEKSEGGDNLNLMFKILKRGEKLDAALQQQDYKNLADLGLRYDLTQPLSRFYAGNRS